MITTTLNAIREHNPCADGWRKLLTGLGKTEADDEPLPLVRVLDINGLADTLWCLRAIGPEHQGWMRHYAVDCAEQVAHLLTDERSREALRAARRYADGLATDEELAAASAAARAAAAWDAARAAARAAANAARDAAWDAAWDAANAARDAAWDAAWDAANAAWDAALDWQTERLRAYLIAGGRPQGGAV